MRTLKKERKSTGGNSTGELNKLKSDFVTLASHEFRTPLTTIQSSAYLLENYISGEHKEKISKHISRILNSVNTLTSMLDEFLSITRIEEGKVKLNAEHMDIKQFMEMICVKLSDFLKPGQRILYQHSGESHIYFDALILEIIVRTLVGNATKYSPEHTDVCITTSVHNHIYLSVKDAGIGIPAEDQVYLFERFFRASNAANIQGTGLGLHIMKLYLNMLQGSVLVKSARGQGSEFQITFDQLSPRV
ncbi:MAG TPA: HAMP domain-containing sensor histidine kinase [Ohtaekwangia sp.]|uniref:sensor histidine kinase n=1 Tax=Ohtaekwangia sp. TaxID=2066019 RepID=UPI002F928522